MTMTKITILVHSVISVVSGISLTRKDQALTAVESMRISTSRAATSTSALAKKTQCKSLTLAVREMATGKQPRRSDTIRGATRSPPTNAERMCAQFWKMNSMTRRSKEALDLETRTSVTTQTRLIKSRSSSKMALSALLPCTSSLIARARRLSLAPLKKSPMESPAMLSTARQVAGLGKLGS